MNQLKEEIHMPHKISRANSLYGFPNPTSNQFPAPIVTNRAPTSYDQGEIGQEWVDQLTNSAWVLTSVGNWESIVGGSGDFSSLVVSGEAELAFDAQNSQYQVVANPTNHTLALTASQALSLGSSNSAIIAVAETDLTLTATTGHLSLFAPDMYVGIDGGEVDIGSSSATRVIIGNISATNTALIASGAPATLGITMEAAGQVSVIPATATSASPTASVTSNTRVINAKFTGFTTATSAVQAFTVVSSDILVTSGIFVTVTNLNASANGAIMTLDGVTQAAGSIIVHTTNNGAGALGAGDTVFVNVWVIS
jgi:hypothetical protein